MDVRVRILQPYGKTTFSVHLLARGGAASGVLFLMDFT